MYKQNINYVLEIKVYNNLQLAKFAHGGGGTTKARVKQHYRLSLQ